MIQRIQSIFLLAAFALQVLMLLLPITVFTIDSDQLIVFKASGFETKGIEVESIYQTTIIFIFLSITALLPLIALLLYKRRIIQMRLCIYNLILLIGFQGILFWFISRISSQFNAISSYQVAFIFPIISAILSYLAFRSIKKDENLIRSLDRIR